MSSLVVAASSSYASSTQITKAGRYDHRSDRGNLRSLAFPVMQAKCRSFHVCSARSHVRRARRLAPSNHAQPISRLCEWGRAMLCVAVTYKSCSIDARRSVQCKIRKNGKGTYVRRRWIWLVSWGFENFDKSGAEMEVSPLRSPGDPDWFSDIFHSVIMS